MTTLPYVPRHARPHKCQHCAADIWERLPGRWEDSQGSEVCIKSPGDLARLPGIPAASIFHTPMPVVK